MLKFSLNWGCPEKNFKKKVDEIVIFLHPFLAMNALRVREGEDITRAMCGVIQRLLEGVTNKKLSDNQKLELEDAAHVLSRINDHIYWANAKMHIEMDRQPMQFSECDEANHRMHFNIRQKRVRKLGIEEEF